MATHFCQECEVHMCDADTRKHAIPKSHQHHHVVPLRLGGYDVSSPPAKAPRLEVAMCATHNEVLKLFDTQCKTPICVMCLSLDHHGHKCTSLEEAADIVRKDAGEAIEAWTSLGKQTRAAEERVQTEHQNLKGNAEQARAAALQLGEEVRAVRRIDLRVALFAHLTSSLSPQIVAAAKKREFELLAEVDEMEKEKDFALSAQVSALQWRGEALGRGMQELKLVLGETNDAVVVVEGSKVLAKREELEEEMEEEAVESATVKLEVDSEALMRAIAGAGSVKTQAAPAAKKVRRRCALIVHVYV